MFLSLSKATILQQILVKKSLKNEKATHMTANNVPQNTLIDLITELMIVLDRNKSHKTLVGIGASGFVERVEGIPPDELWAARFWATDTCIVKELLEP